MPDQVPIGGQEPADGSFVAAEPVITSTRSFTVEPNFSIRAVDPTAAIEGVPGPDRGDPVLPLFGPLPIPADPDLIRDGIAVTSASQVHPLDDGHLGGLDDFVGTFIGNGLNTIFRPRNGFSVLSDDNLLEVNVTKEKLTFLSRDVLDAVPNRGFAAKVDATQAGGNPNRPPQPDVILRGIPYQQTITDLIDQTSGTLQEPGIPIHFEQGLFLRTPALVHPDIPATISRLASIPHGTTINAQAIDPGFGWVTDPAKPPVLEQVGVGLTKANDITPFVIGTTGPIPFENQKITFRTRNRIPNVLDKTPHDFNRVAAIRNFNTPVQTLHNINELKHIVKHRTFEVTTETQKKNQPPKPGLLPGGGTTNIAFLQGTSDPGRADTDANANAVKVTCRYWISVVRVDITVPKTNHGRVEVTPARPEDPQNTIEGVTYVHPTFIVPLKRPNTSPVTFPVDYVQIQYAQNVTLDFGGLSWPHISVATLIPGGADGSGKVELKSEQLPPELK
jgi:hypothetical protein